MSEKKDEHVSTYVEPKLKGLIQQYAARNSITVSRAVRSLVIAGLKVDKRQRLHADTATTQYVEGIAS